MGRRVGGAFVFDATGMSSRGRERGSEGGRGTKSHVTILPGVPVASPAPAAAACADSAVFLIKPRFSRPRRPHTMAASRPADPGLGGGVGQLTTDQHPTEPMHSTTPVAQTRFLNPELFCGEYTRLESSQGGTSPHLFVLHVEVEKSM